jgi:chaperonin GroEL
VGLKLDTAELSVLGRASRVVATKDSTVIVGGKGKKADIDARIAQLKKHIDATESKFDREKMSERLAKLSGGVAVVRVGAATETEMKYLKDKIEDAAIDLAKPYFAFAVPFNRSYIHEVNLN